MMNDTTILETTADGYIIDSSDIVIESGTWPHVFLRYRAYLIIILVDITLISLIIKSGNYTQEYIFTEKWIQ